MLGFLLIKGLEIYSFIIILSVIISWLTAFNVINPRHPAAQNLLRILTRITAPVMEPVRRFVPPIGGIDITPIIVILAIELLKQFVYQLFYGGMFL